MGGMVVDTAGLPVEGWDDVRRGTVTWQTVLGAPTTPASGMTVGVAELAPDGTVGNATHRHAAAEFYYVLSGEGLVEVDGVTSPVRPGSAVLIPGNSWHSLANTGTTTLRVLYGFPVDSMADVHYEFAAEAG